MTIRKAEKRAWQNGTRRTMAKLAGVVLALGAFGATALTTQDAEARDRCTSKPAVCARLKAQEARAEEQAKARAQDQARAAASQRPEMERPRFAVCTTKPAVCSRLLKRDGEPTVQSQQVVYGGALMEQVTVAEVRPEADKAPRQRCTSKPAVCARLGNR